MESIRGLCRRSSCAPWPVDIDDMKRIATSAAMAAILLAGAGLVGLSTIPTHRGPVCIDGSSEQSFARSLVDLEQSMLAEKRPELQEALRTLNRSVLFPAGIELDARQTLQAGLSEPEEVQRRLRLFVHGMTAEELLSAARRERVRLADQRWHPNEEAAANVLRAVQRAQSHLRSLCSIDEDGDGRGEFGSFAELTGNCMLRGSTRALRPAVLRGSFALRHGGVLYRDGYLFRMYLPGPGGAFLQADPPARSRRDRIYPDLAERHFCCYAWPAARGQTGNRVLFIDDKGVLLCSDNLRAGYSGTERPPLPEAAFLAGREPAFESAIAIRGTAHDGQRWSVVH